MAAPLTAAGASDAKTAVCWSRWHTITVATLFLGYSGYYVCRSNLSVVGHEPIGLSKSSLGDIFSIGVLLYAVGKIVNGVAADLLGGRTLFLFGMLGSIVATLAFAWGGSWTFFAIAWGLNRFMQSMGWGGLVQISARWFREDRLATVMGVLSVSFLLGDAAARYYLGWLLAEGFDWRALFHIAAATLAAIAAICIIWLKASPRAVGLPEPPPLRHTVFGMDSGDAGSLAVRRLLGPLLGSTTFWLVCFMSLGMTMLREAFGNWTPAFFREAVGMSDGTAAQASSTFPLVGSLAAICAGWWSDRLGSRYGRIIVPLLALLVGALVLLAYVPVRAAPERAMLLIGVASFCLIGPYTFCAGVLALSLGGQRGGATAAGLIDSAGYFGAILAGTVLGRVIEHFDWRVGFLSLAAVAALTLAVAIVYHFQHEAMTRSAQRGMGS